MKKLLLILATLLLTIQFSTAQVNLDKQIEAEYQQLILVKNYVDAMALLQEFHIKNPDDVPCKVMLTCMYLHLNMQDEAVPLIEELLKSTSKDPKDHMLSLYTFGREDEAWKLAEEQGAKEQLEGTLFLIAGPDPTPAKFRMVLLGIEKSGFEKQMKKQMKK